MLACHVCFRHPCNCPRTVSIGLRKAENGVLLPTMCKMKPRVFLFPREQRERQEVNSEDMRIDMDSGAP